MGEFFPGLKWQTFFKGRRVPPNSANSFRQNNFLPRGGGEVPLCRKKSVFSPLLTMPVLPDVFLVSPLSGAYQGPWKYFFLQSLKKMFNVIQRIMNSLWGASISFSTWVVMETNYKSKQSIMEGCKKTRWSLNNLTFGVANYFCPCFECLSNHWSDFEHCPQSIQAVYPNKNQPPFILFFYTLPCS